MLKYRVILGWRSEFIFDDVNEAITFASAGLTHMDNENDNDDEQEVKIIMFKDGEENV